MPSVAAFPRPEAAARSVPTDESSLLRLLVFSYLGLWVFEGALRKWILPGLSSPLLIIRDPVLLSLYALAFAKGKFPRSPFIPVILGLSVVATFVSLAATETPLMVTAYGWRSNFMHLPLIFLLPNIISRADLWRIGKYVLMTAVGMSVLVLLQFGSSAGSFLNRGAGEGALMLESAYGHIRPSGTFSYTNGLGGFTGITTAFFLQHLLEKRVYPRLVWLAAVPALLIMIILSGSRGAVGGIAFIVCAVMFICLFQTRYLVASLKLLAVLWLAVTVVGSVAVFQQGVGVFAKRFERNKAERHGLAGRYLDGYAQPFVVMDTAPAGGVGLGMSTNVAAGLITGGRKFMFSEGEGGRVVLESGPAVGLAYLMLRLCIVIYVGAQAVRSLRTHGATLPCLIFSACFNSLLIGQFAQATELGFATIAGGLCLAACRAAEEASVAAQDEIIEEKPVAVVEKPARKPLPDGKPMAKPLEPALPAVIPAKTVARVARGRSSYAQRLHSNPTGGNGSDAP